MVKPRLSPKGKSIAREMAWKTDKWLPDDDLAMEEFHGAPKKEQNNFLNNYADNYFDRYLDIKKDGKYISKNRPYIISSVRKTLGGKK
jgi:hypothetical protein